MALNKSRIDLVKLKIAKSFYPELENNENFKNKLKDARKKFKDDEEAPKKIDKLIKNLLKG
jgi:hypothetical protein